MSLPPEILPYILHHLSLWPAAANAILLPPMATLPSAVAASTAVAYRSWSCTLPPLTATVIRCPSSLIPTMPIPLFKIGSRPLQKNCLPLAAAQRSSSVLCSTDSNLLLRGGLPSRPSRKAASWERKPSSNISQMHYPYPHGTCPLLLMEKIA